MANVLMRIARRSGVGHGGSFYSIESILHEGVALLHEGVALLREGVGNVDKIAKEVQQLGTEFRGVNDNKSESNEDEVVCAVHSYLMDRYKCWGPVGKPVLRHKVLIGGHPNPLCELDGVIMMGNGLVALVEVKSRITKKSINQLAEAAVRASGVMKYNRAILFVGGPVIDDDARHYALSRGIGVVKPSGSRYEVYEDPSVQGPFLHEELPYDEVNSATGEE